MKTSTVPVSAPAWYLIDAEGQNLGRMAAKVARVLRGKEKATFSRHQLCGDHVVIINADKMAFHPTKLYRKTYTKHTGYLGHISTQSLEKMLEKDPSAVIKKAVHGMLPGNRLRPQMLKRLHIVTGTEHAHEAQKPQPITIS